ncbi:threonine aspartase 1 [Patella vulgata]|uniref:threonine aspartase 1 n=1 Tax=Patella vulgata TaxID=6465 RepID=UPI0021801CFA|nr:threonine aspartase 1 [Patella vulgata]
MSLPGCFVAVHAGAGFHSPRKEEEYKDVCKTACLQAMQLLLKGESTLSAVTAATISLEDASCTNAGVGSSLTMNGMVECDASIIDGQTSLFGIVGCLQGVRNPIKAAKKLIEKQQSDNLSHGRIPPSVLVGHGARKWCEQSGIETCDPALLITESSKRMHLKYRRKIEGCSSKHEKAHEVKRSRIDEDDINGSVQDTVGAICIDNNGNITASSSSGGIWLKHSGRIGPAATYGAGCWAKNKTKDRSGVAVTTSGSGEDIIRSLLAKTCADHIQTVDNVHQAINEVFNKEFIGDDSEKHGGVLVVKTEDVDSVELLWAHTTDSMCIGYMSSLQKTPKTFISRLPSDSQSGVSLKMEGKYINFTNKK